MNFDSWEALQFIVANLTLCLWWDIRIVWLFLTSLSESQAYVGAITKKMITITDKLIASDKLFWKV